MAFLLQLLLELGPHLCLLEGYLLLDVLVGLHLKLGVHFTLDTLTILLNAHSLIVFQLLQFELLLKLLLHRPLLLNELLTLTDLHRQLVFFRGATEAHVAAAVTGD